MRLHLLLLLLFLHVVLPTSANPSTDSILARYKRYYLNGVSIMNVDKAIPAFAYNLNPQAQWNDINYTDTSPAYWDTRNHLARVEVLSIAWASPSSHYYQNRSLWQTLSVALDHWLDKRYQNSNWWVNEIGVPQGMRDILVLVGDQLSIEQRKKALEVLAQHKVRGVGANLIWSADLAIHYGALVHDEAMIAKSVALVAKEIKVSTGEGIQPDYSYHQHEARLQIYHYGNSFLETNVRLAWEVSNTSSAMPEEKVNILVNFILKGWQWMSRGINTVPGTIDRAASRKDQLHNADLRRLVPYLCELVPANAATFVAIANRQSGKGKALVGFRYYPYSDFTAYHQPNFSFFIKTISTRTLKSESINTENLRGRLLNNGDTYLISTGTEYFNLLPAWNWNLLPGQTNYNSRTDTIVTNTYAGSVSNGQSGLTAMKYTVAGPGEEISAHKFWAAKGNTIVCLVSGLRVAGNDPVFTALDQSRWQGPVTINQPGDTLNTPGVHEVEKVFWLHHNNFGYIPLSPGRMRVRLDTITSAWSAINASASPGPVTDRVFMPLLYQAGNHSPVDGYAMVYASSADRVKEIVQNPNWKVIRNDEMCQAVSFEGGVVLAAFMRAGRLRLNQKDLLFVNRPCLLQITNGRFYASDPLHTGGSVRIILNGKRYLLALASNGTTTSTRR